MTKLAWIAMIPLLLAFTGASAADVNLSKGQLTHDGSYSTQIVAAKNDTGDTLQEIWIECGFFEEEHLSAQEQATPKTFIRAKRPMSKSFQTIPKAQIPLIAESSRLNKTDCLFTEWMARAAARWRRWCVISGRGCQSAGRRANASTVRAFGRLEGHSDERPDAQAMTQWSVLNCAADHTINEPRQYSLRPPIMRGWPLPK